MIPDCQSLPKHTNKYVSEDYLLELFHPYIVSANAVETILSDITHSVDTIGYNSLSLAFDGTNPQTIARNIGEKLCGLQEDLKQRGL